MANLGFEDVAELVDAREVSRINEGRRLAENPKIEALLYTDGSNPSILALKMQELSSVVERRGKLNHSDGLRTEIDSGDTQTDRHQG